MPALRSADAGVVKVKDMAAKAEDAVAVDDLVGHLQQLIAGNNGP